MNEQNQQFMLRQMRARRLPLWPDQPEQFVLPDYGGRSLANVPATIARLLGADLPGVCPPLAPAYWEHFGEVKRVVLILLDGLGYAHLKRMLAHEQASTIWRDLAEGGTLLPMTSIYPSTTATALTTLMTGLTPIQHGMLGYELWLREFGVLAQMLAVQPARGMGRETLLDWGFEPASFVPALGLGKLLSDQGIETTGHVSQEYSRSAFSRMLYRGFTRVVGYSDVEDMWDKARRFLHRDRSKRSLHWVYWGGIDHAAHMHGTADVHEGWVSQYRACTRAFRERFWDTLGPKERRDTLLILCADHGFVDSPAEQAHDIDVDPVFQRELLIPPSGEARASYLHCMAGPTTDVQHMFEQALGDGFVVKPAQDLVQAGLFGSEKPYAEALRRIGHLHAMPMGLRYLDRGQRYRVLKGRHGGLLADEMLAPWLAARLDG